MLYYAMGFLGATAIELRRYLPKMRGNSKHNFIIVLSKFKIIFMALYSLIIILIGTILAGKLYLEISIFPDILEALLIGGCPDFILSAGIPFILRGFGIISEKKESHFDYKYDEQDDEYIDQKPLEGSASEKSDIKNFNKDNFFEDFFWSIFR